MKQLFLFTDDSQSGDLVRDNTLQQGGLFQLAPGKYVSITKKDGMSVFEKSVGEDGGVRETVRRVAPHALLPLALLRWKDDTFYVRFLYLARGNRTKEIVVRLDSLVEQNGKALRQVLLQDGITINMAQWQKTTRLLVDVLHAAATDGTIPVQRALPREWVIDGEFLAARAHVPQLTLISSVRG